MLRTGRSSKEKGAALSTGNVALLDEVYAQEACIVPPGVPAVQRIERIKSFWLGPVNGFGITGARLHT
jgi:hypothetical protein